MARVAWGAGPVGGFRDGKSGMYACCMAAGPMDCGPAWDCVAGAPRAPWAWANAPAARRCVARCGAAWGITGGLAVGATSGFAGGVLPRRLGA